MVGSHSGFKNIKRSAYFDMKGMRVNCDGSSIKDRKPNLKLCSNHYGSFPKIYRIYNRGIARSDGKGWYK